MSLSLLSRYAFFAVCVIFTLASLPFIQHEWLWPITLVTGVLFVDDLLAQKSVNHGRSLDQLGCALSCVISGANCGSV